MATITLKNKTAIISITPNRQIYIDGKSEGQLSERLYRLLMLIFKNSPDVVSYDDIINNIWGGDDTRTWGSVQLEMKNLRNSIHDNDKEIIHNLHNIGYYMDSNAVVEEEILSCNHFDSWYAGKYAVYFLGNINRDLMRGIINFDNKSDNIQLVLGDNPQNTFSDLEMTLNDWKNGQIQDKDKTHYRFFKGQVTNHILSYSAALSEAFAKDKYMKYLLFQQILPSERRDRPHLTSLLAVVLTPSHNKTPSSINYYVIIDRDKNQSINEDIIKDFLKNEVLNQSVLSLGKDALSGCDDFFERIIKKE